MNSTEREALRRRFLPPRVRVLFVGESPPAGGAFFYAGDSLLYRATRDAFHAALGGLHSPQPFLTQFAELGCYLDDLCREPVNALDRSARRAAHGAGEAQLSQTLLELKPAVIIVLLKSIAANVSRAASAAGCAQVERHVVTYPSRWHHHRVRYAQELTVLLRDLRGRGMFERLR